MNYFRIKDKQQITKVLMKTILTFAILFYSIMLAGQTPNFPFPSHTSYSGNYIQPDNYSQAQLDNQAKLFYDEWKATYLKNDCGNTDQYYVYSGSGAKNVSEAQGYGMMIVAYFAGYDPNAQTYFNGLLNFYKAHPSYINSNLMDWQQVTCTDNASSDDDAASDGDIDIAFALLLAHAQWGSSGAKNYLEKALVLIDAIMQDEINQNTWSVKLGDWCNTNSPSYFYGTRTSDFIIDHFKVFECATNNNNWNNVVNTCYDLIDEMQNNYSTTTGLLPDFIVNVNTNAEPAEANYLEDTYDGDYYYNACRTPWRIGIDYLLNGDERAKNAINKINTWLIDATNADVANISNGYFLNGTSIYDWNDATFIGPLTVAAMLNTNNQAWLNSLYSELVDNNNLADGDYYSNTLKLLSMITISGNYWIPDCNTLKVNNIEYDKQDYHIYLNNTNGLIQIEVIKIIDLAEKNKISIIDINGKIIRSTLLTNKHQQINISSYPAGIYFVSIKANKKIETTFKLIKR
ncbi:MAG: T9SS type A sorting domain-containing protein [Chlorobi bacterium]|nr:T9SS type A sorting domain-containing protein [Chlorobiota bacterium]